MVVNLKHSFKKNCNALALIKYLDILYCAYKTLKSIFSYKNYFALLASTSFDRKPFGKPTFSKETFGKQTLADVPLGDRHLVNTSLANNRPVSYKYLVKRYWLKGIW
jgi:hypothetical protein